MLLVGKKPEAIKIGQIIVFESKKPYPIIHRVINKENMSMWVFQTKGDNNYNQIREYINQTNGAVANFNVGAPIPSGYIPVLDETQVLEKQILGKAVVRVPWLGYVKIWFVDVMQATGIYGLFNPAQ
jgi:signal peptidase I